MNRVPFNELYSEPPFTSPRNMHHAYSYPPPPYFDVPRFEQGCFPPPTSISSTLQNLDGYLPPSSRPQCAQCKGHKYNFTAYFHNKAIFPEPPHELIPWIQQSYLLKNRLQSLLITYFAQEVDPTLSQEIEIGINNWRLQVEALTQEVGTWGGGSEAVVSNVSGVHQWTMNMVKQLRNHVGGRQKLPLPKGRVKELVLEFRKGWERAWIASAEYQRGLMVPHGCSVGYSS